MASRTVLLIAAALSLSHRPARAEDRGALEAVGLFAQTCVTYAGLPGDVRAWARSHNLPQSPPAEARIFAHDRPASVFGASTAAGRMVLVSDDSGACQVIVQSGDAANMRDAMTSLLASVGMSITPGLTRDDPGKGASQHLYKAALGSRRWTLSVTSHAAPGAPGALPEITLAATSDPRAP